MSAYKVLYDDVYDALENSTLIKTVDDFNDQYNNAKDFNIVEYPVCYVEADAVEWNRNQNNFRNDFQKEPQTGTATIRVHLVYKTLKGYNKEEKAYFYYLGNHVVSLLQRLRCVRTDGGTYTTLLRISDEYPEPIKQLRVVIYEFEAELADIFEPIATTEEEEVIVTLATKFN
jgi:hypothetical protein